MHDVPPVDLTSHKVRISWTIPIPLIVAILGQAAVIGWVGATWTTAVEKDMENDRERTHAQFQLIDRRIQVLETAISASASLTERVKGVEVNVEVLKAQSQNIENKLDKLIDNSVRHR